MAKIQHSRYQDSIWDGVSGLSTFGPYESHVNFDLWQQHWQGKPLDTTSDFKKDFRSIL